MNRNKHLTIGIKLSWLSRRKLLSRISPVHAICYADHVILGRKHNISSELEDLIGQPVRMTATGDAFTDEFSQAISIDPTIALPFSSRKSFMHRVGSPHIVISNQPDRPLDRANLVVRGSEFTHTDVRNAIFSEQFVLTGTIYVFPHKQSWLENVLNLW